MGAESDAITDAPTLALFWTISTETGWEQVRVYGTRLHVQLLKSRKARHGGHNLAEPIQRSKWQIKSAFSNKKEFKLWEYDLAEATSSEIRTRNPSLNPKSSSRVLPATPPDNRWLRRLGNNPAATSHG
jgi:hypothetical protein